MNWHKRRHNWYESDCQRWDVFCSEYDLMWVAIDNDYELVTRHHSRVEAMAHCVQRHNQEVERNGARDYSQAASDGPDRA